MAMMLVAGSFAVVAHADDTCCDVFEDVEGILENEDERVTCDSEVGVGGLLHETEEEIDSFSLRCCGCGCWDRYCCGFYTCRFTWPVPASRTIRRGFAYNTHNGIDISPSRAGVAGDSVVAFLSGQVIRMQHHDSLGHHVVINSSEVHDFQWVRHRYAHLDSYTVSLNQVVGPGTQVGKMGIPVCGMIFHVGLGYIHPTANLIGKCFCKLV